MSAALPIDLTKRPWWEYIGHDLQELMLQGFDLFRVSNVLDTYHDYSFIVFPMSKAYEGFLKKIFLDMQFIDAAEYEGTRFRIGKALNPSLDPKARDEQWVYGKLSKYCGGVALPNQLWDAWRECRNLVFHWFPKDSRDITREEAGEKLHQVVAAIDAVFRECKISL